MTTTSTRIAGWSALALSVASLAACGGGGDSAPADPFVAGTQVPQSATQSADGSFAFASQSGAAQDNTGEPLVLGDAALGKSETDEPKPL
jgi:hypothetical protein